MPCSVDPIPVNYSKENKQLKEICDEAYHALDVAREKIIEGEKPDLTVLIKMERFKGSRVFRMDRSSGPFEGTPPDHRLVDLFHELKKEAGQYFDGKYDIVDVESKQRAHRIEDIKRLRVHFASIGDEEGLRSTMDIDYDRPLKPQLGYDPNDY